MDRRRMMFVAVAVACLLGAIVMLLPLANWLIGDEEEVVGQPEFGSQVAVSDARLVLPATAGEPARLYFSLANSGERTIFLTAVSVENASSVEIVDTVRPQPVPIANFDVQPGQTLQFAPGKEEEVWVTYDSDMVPGAQVRVDLTLGNAQTLSTTATVESAVGPGGVVTGAPAES